MPSITFGEHDYEITYKYHVNNPIIYEIWVLDTSCNVTFIFSLFQNEWCLITSHMSNPVPLTYPWMNSISENFNEILMLVNTNKISTVTLKM